MNWQRFLAWLWQSTKATVAAAAVVLALSISAASESYDIERERELRAKMGAPLWSLRCERRGMDTLAVKPDSGPWQLRCVRRQVLRVPPPEQLWSAL